MKDELALIALNNEDEFVGYWLFGWLCYGSIVMINIGEIDIKVSF